MFNFLIRVIAFFEILAFLKRVNEENENKPTDQEEET